jgi:hypothetical protein
LGAVRWSVTAADDLSLYCEIDAFHTKPTRQGERSNGLRNVFYILHHMSIAGLTSVKSPDEPVGSLSRVPAHGFAQFLAVLIDQ